MQTYYPLVAIAVVNVLLLLAGFARIVVYGYIQPDADRALAEIRALHEHFRSTVWPAVTATVVGLFISLAASLFYGGFSSERFGLVQAGFGVLLISTILLAWMIFPMLHLSRSMAGQAWYPQRISVVARGIMARELHAMTNIDALDEQLHIWKTDGAALIIGWTRNTSDGKPGVDRDRRGRMSARQSFNRVFEGLEANRQLSRRQAWGVLWRSGAYRSAWRAAHLRFGWMLYLLAVLGVLWVVAQLRAGQPPSQVLLETGLVTIASAICVFVYWTSSLMEVARRVAIGRSFLGVCEDELQNATKRVEEAQLKERQWAELPKQISKISARSQRDRWVSSVGVATVTLVATASFLVLKRSGAGPANANWRVDSPRPR